MVSPNSDVEPIASSGTPTDTPISLRAEESGTMRPRQEVFLARQPIFDENKRVVAYELLFRSGDTSAANITDGDMATTQTLLNSLVEIGLNNLVGPHLAFVNLTRSFLTGQNPLPVPTDKVVLEILETEIVDEELLAGIASLNKQGYVLALDDVIEDDERSSLLEMVKIVKLEYPALKGDKLNRVCSKYRKLPVKLLAEKVETAEEFEHCRAQGIKLFQGYFFAKPEIVRGRSIPNDQLRLLQILASLQNPEIAINELESMIVQDVALSYKLMRYINSVVFGLSQEVRSIKQAVTLLGLRKLKSLASLLALSKASDKPKELLRVAMIRAKTCELIASMITNLDVDAAFTVGLFSLLDALLDQPMEDVLNHLPLSEDIQTALSDRDGALGTILAMVVANEEGDMEVLSQCTEYADAFNTAYVEAVSWANSSEMILDNEAA